MVVHGIPGDYELKRGDIISIDVGVVYDGWVADAAQTIPVGPVSEPALQLLETTRESLFAGIAEAKAGNHLGDISAAIQRRVEQRRPRRDQEPGRPRHRPPHARGPADPQLRRARHAARCWRRG